MKNKLKFLAGFSLIFNVLNIQSAHASDTIDYSFTSSYLDKCEALDPSNSYSVKYEMNRRSLEYTLSHEEKGFDITSSEFNTLQVEDHNNEIRIYRSYSGNEYYSKSTKSSKVNFDIKDDLPQMVMSFRNEILNSRAEALYGEKAVDYWIGSEQERTLVNQAVEDLAYCVAGLLDSLYIGMIK